MAGLLANARVLDVWPVNPELSCPAIMDHANCDGSGYTQDAAGEAILCSKVRRDWCFDHR
jgi:hypothetical protein